MATMAMTAIVARLRAWFIRVIDWRWSQCVWWLCMAPVYWFAPKPWQTSAGYVWCAFSVCQMVHCWRQIRLCKPLIAERKQQVGSQLRALESELYALRKEHPEWWN